jgi:hypothetical protein
MDSNGELQARQGQTHAEYRQTDALYCGLFHRGFVRDRCVFVDKINSAVTSEYIDVSPAILKSAKAAGKRRADPLSLSLPLSLFCAC